MSALKFTFTLFVLLGIGFAGNAQTGAIEGIINDVKGHPMKGVTIGITSLNKGAVTGDKGDFRLERVPVGKQMITVTMMGYEDGTSEVEVVANTTARFNTTIRRKNQNLGEVVVSGTLKPLSKSESPVLVQSYNAHFFKKNASPNVYEALSTVNGVRPQMNCNVCNTGDIHINGLEGPYTMMLIDGMPIMSSLGTVYGFSGIPVSMIERVEVVKGPASTLYGSEAMGGLINIITKNPQNQPLMNIDVSATTWGEYNADLGVKNKIGDRVSLLTGVNYYNFDQKKDMDHDGFTDKTLQDRISIFQKWNIERDQGRIFTLGARYMYEDRWGGETNWTKAHRGGDDIYAESIYTNRVELIGNYQLPTVERMFFQFSFINHDQNSAYGDEWYIANQKVLFGQLIWNKEWGINDLTAGAAMRYTYYDDNTPATAKPNGIDNDPERTYLPGIFVQDDIKFSRAHRLLLGLRYDHNNIHGDIVTPRLAYKWTIDDLNTLRINSGTGYRVVNVFNEDHSALTGGRDVLIGEDLKPEQSYNVSVDYARQFYFGSGNHVGVDVGGFYTYFTNRIIGDFESNPTMIIYDNLKGRSISKGLSMNIDVNLTNGLNMLIGGTLLHNTVTEENDHGVIETKREIQAESFNGTWTISYQIPIFHLNIDYTGNLYGPMRLPLMGDLDPRPEFSPWWSIQNIQFTYSGFRNLELYAGVKNLLNWTVGRDKTSRKYFNIARSNDPFDNYVQFDRNDEPVPVTNVPKSDPRYNPYGLIFDPDSYVYAPNQGINGIFGVRFSIK